MRQLINWKPSASVLNAVTSEEFKIYAKADAESVDLMVFDGIGKDDWTGAGVGAGDVAAFLSEHSGKPVNVRINSPGGLVNDGIAIHNALIQHDGVVTTTVEGISASAATIIQMAGSRVRMYENASMMIHKAWGIAVGNSALMLDVADWLDRADRQIAATYSAKSGRKPESMLRLMEGKVDGTLMSADQALSEKFIDEILPLPKGRARGAANEADDVAKVQAALANERRVKAANAAARLRLMEIG